VTIPQAAPYYRLFACAHTIAQLAWGFRFLDASYMAATFLEHLEDCTHSHHLSSTMRPMDFGQVNCIERQRFSEFSVEARYSKRNVGPPSLSQRDVEAPGAGMLPTPTCILWL